MHSSSTELKFYNSVVIRLDEHVPKPKPVDGRQHKFFLSMDVHFFLQQSVNKVPNIVYFQHIGNWVLPVVCAKLGANPYTFVE